MARANSEDRFDVGARRRARSSTRSLARRALRTAICWASAVAAVGQTPGPYPSQALRVDVQNGHAAQTGWAGLIPPYGMTFEFWALLDPSRAAATATVSSPVAVRKWPSFGFYCTSSAGGPIVFQIQFDPESGLTFANLTSNVSLLPNTWHHIAATHDGTLAALYVDGVLEATAPAPGPMVDYPTGEMRVGSEVDHTGRAWNGDLDELRLWDYARTPEQIAAYRHLRIDAAPGLVAAWHFDGDFSDGAGPYDFTDVAGVSLVASTSPVRQEVALHGFRAAAIGTPASYVVATTLGSRPYVFDVTPAGPYPGVALPPPLLGVLPLNPPWVFTSFGPWLPPSMFAGFVGVTGPDGLATATFAVPDLPSLTWAPITGAVVLLDGASPYGIRAVSNPWSVVATPPPPTLTSASPNFLASATTNQPTVTVTGSGITAVSAVRVGKKFATNVTALPPNAVSFTPPSQPLGVYDVVVEVLGEVATTLSAGLTYVTPPGINGVSYPFAIPGSTVSIFGPALNAGTVATVAGVPVGPLTQVPSGWLFTVPAGVPCPAQIVVTDPVSGLSGSYLWNVPANVSGATVVSGSPATGPAAGGSLFYVNGGPFAVGTLVAVGGAGSLIVGFSLNQLTCVAPPGSIGPASVVVYTPSACPTVSPNPFVYF
jgi:hypothetical protein